MKFGEPSPPLFIVEGRGGGRQEVGCPKGGPPLPNITPPKVGGCPKGGGGSSPWPAHGGLPQGAPPLPTCPTICGGCPPPWGPPTTSSTKRGLPPKGGAPYKTAPTNHGILSPIRGHCVFCARSLRKNSGRSQNFSGTLQKILDACQNFSGLMVYSETFFRFLQNTSGFLSETFSVSPKLFR